MHVPVPGTCKVECPCVLSIGLVTPVFVMCHPDQGSHLGEKLSGHRSPEKVALNPQPQRHMMTGHQEVVWNQVPNVGSH